MYNHLICVGFGKCGTTLLNFLFKRSPRFTVPMNRKEILYFNASNPKYSEYLKNFEIANHSLRTPHTLFEASPPYVTGMPAEHVAQVFRRIRATIPEAFILICVRHPAYRAFSHYIHNLHAFSVWGDQQHVKPLDHPAILLSKPCSASFADALGYMDNVNCKYYEAISQAVNTFGSEKVMFFSLEEDGPTFGHFFSRLCTRLNMDGGDFWKERNIPKVFSTDVMPSYVCSSSKHDTSICAQLEKFALRKNDFLAISRRDTLLLEDLHNSSVEALIQCSNSWTPSVSAHEFKDIFETYFAKDIEKTVDFLNRNRMDASRIENYLDYEYTDKSLNRIELNPNDLSNVVRISADPQSTLR